MVASLLVFMSSFVNQERLEYIERDEREYTLDEEDRKVQDAILDRDPSRNHTVVLKKSLSCSYPNLPFDEALQEESEKLQLELQRSQTLDPGQCEVIQHLIGVTQTVASTLPENSGSLKNSRKLEPNFSDEAIGKEYSVNGKYFSQQSDTKLTSRLVFIPSVINLINLIAATFTVSYTELAVGYLSCSLYCYSWVPH